MSENQRKPSNSGAENDENQSDKFVDQIWKLVESIQPYNRKVLEKMTREEQRAYNVGYGVIGVLCLLTGVLDGLWNLIAGERQGLSFLLLAAGVGCLLYYWNPFCYADLWKSVKAVIFRTSH